jgi:RNA polymerase sigma-70 factor (ECF subfamily)
LNSANLQRLPITRSHDAVDDDRIVAEFLARRENGLDGVYRAYGKALFSVARHTLHDDDEAQDCVHDVLLRLWEKPESYRQERGTLRSFLMACVRNGALTRLRSTSRRLHRERELALVAPANYDIDVRDHVEADRLREAFAALPGEQRIALQLAYGHHLSQSQIAGRLSVPLGTVKSRVSLGLRRLQSLMVPSPEAGA